MESKKALCGCCAFGCICPTCAPMVSHTCKPRQCDHHKLKLTPDGDYYRDAGSSAEEYLDSLVPEGFWVGSNENGDFGMWVKAKTANMPEKEF